MYPFLSLQAVTTEGHRLGGLMNNRHLYLTVLEAGGEKCTPDQGACRWGVW